MTNLTYNLEALFFWNVAYISKWYSAEKIGNFNLHSLIYPLSIFLAWDNIRTVLHVIVRYDSASIPAIYVIYRGRVDNKNERALQHDGNRMEFHFRLFVSQSLLVQCNANLFCFAMIGFHCLSGPHCIVSRLEEVVCKQNLSLAWLLSHSCHTGLLPGPDVFDVNYHNLCDRRSTKQCKPNNGQLTARKIETFRAARMGSGAPNKMFL